MSVKLSVVGTGAQDSIYNHVAAPVLAQALRAVLALCPTENPELIEAGYAVPADLILEAIADAGVEP